MFPLFAQAAQNKHDYEMFVFFLVFIAIFVLVLYVPHIFFLLTVHKALSRCSPRKRTMEPGQVWLDLIPCVHTVWQFFIVIRVAESLKREFRSRGMRYRNEDFGQALGIVACVGPFIPYIGILVYITCGIIYWSKIAGYSRQLAEDDLDLDEYEDDDYDDDDRRDDDPYERRYRDEDDDDRRRGRRRCDEYDDRRDDDRW